MCSGRGKRIQELQRMVRGEGERQIIQENRLNEVMEAGTCMEFLRENEEAKMHGLEEGR